MSININAILGNIEQYSKIKKNNNCNSNINITENIFAQASEIVAKYKAKQDEEENSSSSSANKNIFGLSSLKMANMSTSEFLKYAYENKAESGFENNTLSEDGSEGIKLPIVVMYAGRTVTTAGKTFMQVVTKMHSMFPSKSEEEIAAILLAKYGNNSSNSATGKSLNMSA